MYMAMNQQEASLFFIQLISYTNILSSNKGPEDWDELLGDQGITTAILDRLLHRSEVIHLDGDNHHINI